MEWTGTELESLVSRARDSEDGEAFLSLRTGENGRLGVCAECSEEGTEFILELLVRVLNSGPIYLRRCYRGLDIAREGMGLSFKLTSQEDGWIYCQKSVLPADIGTMSATVGRLIE
jgi:hypothetical protein